MDEDNGKELQRGLVGVAGSGPPFAVRTQHSYAVGYNFLSWHVKLLDSDCSSPLQS